LGSFLVEFCSINVLLNPDHVLSRAQVVIRFLG
jgi:hypothetical protein